MSATVKLGDRDIEVSRFNGLKGILAMAIVSRISTKAPELDDKVAGFVKDYEEKHTETITPVLARLPRYAAFGFTDEDFQSSGGTITVPQPPGPNQLIMAILPDIIEFAQDEIQRLLALVAIPNSQLEEADDNDRVDEELTTFGRSLMRRGYLEELAELLVVGWGVLQSQFEGKTELTGSLGKLPFLQMLRSTPQRPQPTTGSLEEGENDSTPETSTDEQPTSSTDSLSPTDGTDERLSTVSPGASSSD